MLDTILKLSLPIRLPAHVRLKWREGNPNRRKEELNRKELEDYFSQSELESVRALFLKEWQKAWRRTAEKVVRNCYNKAAPALASSANAWRSVSKNWQARLRL